jgi:hypothetical protein
LSTDAILAISLLSSSDVSVLIDLSAAILNRLFLATSAPTLSSFLIAVFKSS